jgi:hypothetical protein
MSSIAEPGSVPTKLFGLFNMAECEGRRWEPAVAGVDVPVESVRRAERLYLSGAARIGADGASDDCEDVPLFTCGDRGAVAALLVPGTGRAESSRVPTLDCRPASAVLGRLVIDKLAEYREWATAGCR